MEKIVVRRDDFHSVIAKLCKTGEYDIDCETTGLKWYDKDHLFAITIGDANTHYYFDFNHTQDHLGIMTPEETRLPREWLSCFKEVFQNESSLWFAHNAKFDLAMLAKEGLWVAGTIHCTEAIARLLNSNYNSYTLSECVTRMNKHLGIKGEEKSADVMEYVTKHKLYRDVDVLGKEKAIREVWFHKVPFRIMVDYTLTDGVVTQNLGQYQLKEISRISLTNKKFKFVVDNERALTKTALNMALEGIPYDRDYVRKALQSEIIRMNLAKSEWKGHTGQDFVDSGVAFAKVFDEAGIPYFRTEAGSPSFDQYNIEKMDESPLLNVILDFRGAAKLAGTYYSSFEYYGANGKIHADMRQGGTRTGRVSYREPNMQNIPKPDEDSDTNDKAMQVRACFKPDEDYCFFMPDYDQMEYRMMLDLANEEQVIKLILWQGLDVHEATAKMMNVTRKEAKTINFMLLYGGGISKLANALGITDIEAKGLKGQYFTALPHVKKWIYRTVEAAKINKTATNPFGRVVQFDRGFEYKIPNYMIQGGCADVVKVAMNRVEADMRKEGLKSRMLLQIHDELLFKIHKSELDYCPKIVQIMESVYPAKKLPLTAGPSYSWKNWAEKVDGYPKLP